MSSSHRYWLAMGLAGLGLAASTLLSSRALGSDPGLCSIGGGCDIVQSSRWAAIAGVPLPLLGAGYFAAMIALLGVARARVARWLGVIGGGVGVALLAIQGFAIGSFCPWCVGVDVSSIALALAAWNTQPPTQRARILSGAAALAPLALVFTWVALATPSSTTPTSIAPAAPTTDVAVATITEFVDFQCPHCRRLHHRLAAILEPYGERVRVVRHHVPLPRHPHAETAARAACCAESAGVGDAMADRLFSADDLRPHACAELAESLGLKRAEFEQCTHSAATDARLADDRNRARAADIRSLPTTFIGDRRFVGAVDEHELAAAVAHAVTLAEQQSAKTAR